METNQECKDDATPVNGEASDGEVSDSASSYQTMHGSEQSTPLKTAPEHDSPSRYSETSTNDEASMSTNGYLTASENSLNTTVIENLSAMGNGTDSPDKLGSFSHFPSLDIAGDGAPGAPAPDSRCASPSKTVTDKLKTKIRHMSGVDPKTPLPPPLDVPVTKEKFMFVLDHLQANDLSVKSIEDYLKTQDMREDDIIDDNDSKTALHVLCGSENASVKCFNALINSNHNPRLQTERGDTALHLAVKLANSDIITELMKLCPDLILTQDRDGWTPIHIAVLYNNDRALNIFTKFTNKLALTPAANHMTPLHLAVKKQKELLNLTQDNGLPEDDKITAFEVLNIIERILLTLITSSDLSQLRDALITPFRVVWPEQYPLHILVENNQYSIIKLIVEKVKYGEIYETINADQMTPFSLSLYLSKKVLQKQESMMDSELMEHIEQRIQGFALRDLVPKRKKKSVKSEKDKKSNRKELLLDTAKILLQNMNLNIDVKVPKFYNMTPLQMVLHRDQSLKVEKEIVQILIEKEANVFGEDGPIIDILGHNYRSDIVSMFLEHLENVNERDKYGNTIFHYAARYMDEDNMTKLYEKQADPTVEAECFDSTMEKECLTKTPLTISIKHNSSGVYLKSLRKALDSVIEYIPSKALLKFFQTHLVASASISDKEMIRDLCNHLSKKSLLKRISNEMSMEEDHVIRSIINYSDKSHYEETFHRTALAWANENDDPISVSDLLHLIKATHPSKEEGLRCIKQQITNDKLLFWITRTFSRFYPNSPGKMWSKAFIISLITLGISYFGFIFDIYTDFELTYDYSAAYSDIENYTRLMMECASARINDSQPFTEDQDKESCFIFNDQYPQQTYIVAYWMTLSSMFVSLLAYIIGITVVFNMKNLTEKKFPAPDENTTLTGKAIWTIKQILFWIIIRMFWPFFHLYRKLRYEASEVKSSRRKKFIEFETIWIMVRTIEHGIEATVQLIIVLYLLVPYYDEIHNWSFQATVKKTSSGIFHFLTLGKYPACLIEKVVGKLFMNVIAQSISLTLLKYLKYGMSLPDHLASMFPVFASNTLQIIARLYAMRVFFVTAEDLLGTNDKGLAIGIGFLLHFLAVFLIKITFEIRKENFHEDFWWNVKFYMKFTINLLSSCLLYVQTNEYGTKPRDNINQHNTFLPQLMFQILILIEHLIVIIFPIGLLSNYCLDRETYINTAYIVPALWIISNLSLIWHYKDCHTWSQINGPSCTCIPQEESQHEIPNDGVTPPGSRPDCPGPQVSCFTLLCCQNVQIICSCSKMCFKIENQEKHKLYKVSDKIELKGLNSSITPLITDNSTCSSPD